MGDCPAKVLENRFSPGEYFEKWLCPSLANRNFEPQEAFAQCSKIPGYATDVYIKRRVFGVRTMRFC
jgi:hypothetical protein